MRIHIGMPVYRGIHPNVVKNIIEFDLENQEKKHQLVLHFPQSSIITASRNLIVREALKQNADWILMWDSDIEILDKTFFKQIIDLAYKENAQIIGIPCRLKSTDNVWNCAKKLDNKYINYGTYPQKTIKAPKESFEIDVIGTGFMGINSQWLSQYWPKGPWFSIIDTETGFFPEDWNFCEKVKEKGAKIMALPIKTIHWGEYPYEI